MAKLLDLPAEILHAIVCELCPHCVPLDQESGSCISTLTTFAPDVPYRPPLTALSRTCKALHAITQPILYHFPVPPDKDDRFIPLVRTLLQHPKLAEAVRHMSIQGWQLSKAELSERDAEFFGEHLDRYSAIYDTLNVRLSKDWHRQHLSYWRSPGEAFAWTPAAALASLALTVIRNVEVLDITLSSGWEFPICKPGSLQHLTRLHLSHTDMSTGFGLDEVSELLVAAPSLDFLSAYAVIHGSREVRHTNLRTLELRSSALDAEDIMSIMKGCPALEKFHYHGYVNGELIQNEATPREIAEAVRARKKTLKHLVLHFNNVELPSGYLIESLKDMEVLETLELRDADLEWDHMDLGSELQGDDAYNLLGELLPPTITAFTLNFTMGFIWKEEEAITRLAGVVSSKFPRLKRTEFACVGDEQTELVKGLATLFPEVEVIVRQKKYAFDD